MLTKESEVHSKDKKDNQINFNNILFENQNFRTFKLLN